ncbi:tyrosine-type recombinase/integrase [Pseudoalteromonas prydzensis]|uniref:Integrase arm-type DNA-binding domain-containing protein n=1 Tax=Pseudoalteromonas prydzensis TaxID=182141 RepID=A0ABR9FSR9_9GAMM|nr:site-specific integrase [Pseudoalteromonas prydzensis]MBE0459881.1 integrase arm-type DNA-binding domain-containing protein [Pseudoalteromonas prydzensis]
MNDAQLKAKLKEGKSGKHSVDRGLYFRITDQKSAFWIVRYTINSKRRELTIGRYGKPPEGLSLANAKIEAANVRAQVNKGLDPIAERKRSSLIHLKTVDEVAEDWLKVCDKRLENPQIPRRVYKKDISPSIGELTIDRVTPRDILGIIRNINDSNRPTIANDALIHCKQIFNHAIKLGLIEYNVALPFSNKDAGGVEKSRTRALSFEELNIVFNVFKKNSDQFTRENYIACLFLVCLGIRKQELIAAKWFEFDLDNYVWMLPAERTKTKVAIRIPIPEELISYFHELKIRSCDSEYLFPARRASKRRGFISDDTLNHALAKLFGNQGYKKKEKFPNLLGEAGIQHFVIHDLRRTCRSLLSELAIPSHIAERCLNHKIRGVEGIYDRYDYFEERKSALTNLTEHILDLL